MSIGIRRPHQAVDLDEVARMYPPPPEYFETRWFDEPEQIDRLKLSRVKDRAMRAARIPFHARRWADAGFDPRSIDSLDDLRHVPLFDVDDIRRSIDDHPPLGDYQAIGLHETLREPVRIHMSGGTTGKPRPTLYTQWDREVGGILTARGVHLQGVRPGDVVLNSWSYGLHNGAFAFDEALHRWLNCTVITTSTGNVTATRKQVELARDYRASAILATGDYLLRIVEEAEKMGLDPRRDLAIRSLATNVGGEEDLERIFGVPAHSTYGFHEVQYVAVECPARTGLHIFEDAFHPEVVDPDTGEPVPDGQPGTLVLTELYKTGSAQFRYNTLDLTFLYPRERCECGSWTRRMGRFGGRADNMIKLRGVNVWPEGVAEIARPEPGATGDYFVRALRREGRDELVFMMATELPEAERPALATAVEGRIQNALGVRIGVEIVGPGELDGLTEVATSPKPKRFRDER